MVKATHYLILICHNKVKLGLSKKICLLVPIYFMFICVAFFASIKKEVKERNDSKRDRVRVKTYTIYITAWFIIHKCMTPVYFVAK